ncbi:hypothetical protein L1887_45783 [Cichorium endivia]|nr:hypothetical protein L1887_45783 [Cichorium endivia]
MAMVGKAPAVANARQLFIITGRLQRLRAEVQTTVFDVLRHHQPLLGKHAVEAAHGHTALGGNPFRAQRFRLNMVVNQRHHMLELALLARLNDFTLLECGAQQADHRFERRFALPVTQVGIAHALHQQAMAQLYRRQGAGKGGRAAYLLETTLLLNNLAGNQQRNLAGFFPPVDRAGTRRVNQRDITGSEQRATVILLNFRAAFELEHGIEPGIITLSDLLTGAEQVYAACGHGAELQAARIAGLQLAEEFPPGGLRVKTPANLVNLRQPLLILFLLACTRHRFSHCTVNVFALLHLCCILSEL